MFKPLLKQYNALTRADFDAHPIWVCVHGIDDEEPWAFDSDELTHRPYDGRLPYICSNPEAPMVLVRTHFALADGTQFEGFSSPPYFGDDPSGRSVSYRQPQLILPDGRRFGFWFGAIERLRKDLHQFYAAIGKRPSEIFPITYRIAPGLTDRDDEEAKIIGFGTMKPDFTGEIFET